LLRGHICAHSIAAANNCSSISHLRRGMSGLLRGRGAERWHAVYMKGCSPKPVICTHGKASRITAQEFVLAPDKDAHLVDELQPPHLAWAVVPLTEKIDVSSDTIISCYPVPYVH
jgi:hypothetical protein